MRFKFVLALLALAALAGVGCDYVSLLALEVGGVSVPNNSVTYDFDITINAPDAATAAAAVEAITAGLPPNG